MMCLGVDFLLGSYLEFAQLLESTGLCLLPNMGSLWLFFQFQFHAHSLPLQDSDMPNIRSFVIVP